MSERTAVTFRAAQPKDGEAVHALLAPFVEAQLLLHRELEELRRLTKHAFVAWHSDQLIGFAAVEIYSAKLAEIQCLAVDASFQRQGVGRALIQRCIDRAREENVLELMAITASEDVLRDCGFDYSLPNQKRAMFIRTRES